MLSFLLRLQNLFQECVVALALLLLLLLFPLALLGVVGALVPCLLGRPPGVALAGRDDVHDALPVLDGVIPALFSGEFGFPFSVVAILKDGAFEYLLEEVLALIGIADLDALVFELFLLLGETLDELVDLLAVDVVPPTVVVVLHLLDLGDTNGAVLGV